MKKIEAETPTNVREDDDGRWWIVPGSLSRRQLLGGAGAAIAAGLGVVAAQSGGEVVGGDNAVVGGGYEVPTHVLDQRGTGQSLYVALRPEHWPDSYQTPALFVSVSDPANAADGNPMIDVSGSPGYSDTLRTNLAEVHATDSDPDGVTVSNAPALILGKEGGWRLVIDSEPHVRSAVGGSAAEINYADDIATVPSGPNTPALEYGAAGGPRVNV